MWLIRLATEALAKISLVLLPFPFSRNLCYAPPGMYNIPQPSAGKQAVCKRIPTQPAPASLNSDLNKACSLGWHYRLTVGNQF